MRTEPFVSTGSEGGLPPNSDETEWLANFLEHDILIGYPSDKWSRNDGVDDAPEFV